MRPIIAFFCLILVGCQTEPLTVNEVKAYILDEENGLKKTVNSGDTKVSILYRPTDLIVAQEIGNTPTDSTAINRSRVKYNNYCYFILSFQKNDHEALSSLGGPIYSEVVSNLSFKMREYVTITTSTRETVELSDFMFDRTYGMGRATEVLLVFPKEKISGAEWILINVDELGLGIGSQRFRFDMDDIKEAPTVRFAFTK